MNKPLYSTIILILSLGFGFFYVKPQFDITGQHRADIATLDDTLKGTGQIQLLIQQTEKTLGGIDANQLSRFSVFLPETIDPLRLANNLQQIGFSHSIMLGKIKVWESANLPVAGTTASALGGVVATPKLQKYVTTKTSFDFTASNESFQAFLSDIERNLGLMNVTSLSFVPVAASTDPKIKGPTSPLYQYSVEIETYSLK